MMTDRSRKSRHLASRGVTLIETVIVIALFVILLIAIVNMTFSYNDFFASQQATFDVANSARSLTDAVHDAVLQADRIMTSHVYSGTTYASGPTVLVLEMPSIDSGGNILSNTFDYEVIYASGSKVFQITDPNAGSARLPITKALSYASSTLTITYDNATPSQAHSLIVDILTSATTSSRTIQTELHQQAYLRNL